MVAANLAALKFDGSGVFNIATGVETSVNELYEKLSKLLSGPTSSTNASAVKGEILRSALDASRARKELSWEPKVSLDEGLAKTGEFFKKADA